MPLLIASRAGLTERRSPLWTLCHDAQRGPHSWPRGACGHILIMTPLSPPTHGLSPGHITVLVPRLTMAPPTETQTKQGSPSTCNALGAQPGVKDERNSYQDTGAASPAPATTFPTPRALPWPDYIPRLREASRTRWYQSFPSKRNSSFQFLKHF